MLLQIQRLIDENRLTEALEKLAPMVSAGPDCESALVMRGKVYWRLQDYGAATSDFSRAVALNPDSEARAALELAQSIFDYYNPDLLNP